MIKTNEIFIVSDAEIDNYSSEDKELNYAKALDLRLTDIKDKKPKYYIIDSYKLPGSTAFSIDIEY